MKNLFKSLTKVAFLALIVVSVSCDSLKPLQATTADYFDLNYNGFPITVKDTEYKVNPMIKENPDQLINLIQGQGKDKDFLVLEKFLLGQTILQNNTFEPETQGNTRLTIRVGDLTESKFARRGN